MAKILTLAPAFGTVPNTWLKGELYAGNIRVDVAYPNTPTLANATAGALALNTALHANAGTKIVLGHSMGAQVICKWLRDYGPTSDISPSDVSFVLTGNLERKYNGASNVTGATFLGIQVTAAYGGSGIPAGTPYTVNDYARQYDFWADQPNLPRRNQPTVQNAQAGLGVHLDYANVGLSDVGNVSVTEGTITYTLSPTYPLPLLKIDPNLIHWLPTWWVSFWNGLYKTQVEGSYTRPVNPA